MASSRRCCAGCASCGGAANATVLRALAGVNVVAGLVLIIFGSTVERPINSAPTVCMILLGVFSWLTAATGMLGSTRAGARCCCLDVFLALDGVHALLTGVLVLELWLNFDGLLAAIGASAGCCCCFREQGLVAGGGVYLRRLVVVLVVSVRSDSCETAVM